MTRADRSGRELIFLSGLAALLGVLIFAPETEDVLEGYGYALRVTARVTMVFFLLAYVARPLVQLFGVGRWLVRQRRYLGLMAALSHTVHFGYVLLYEVSNEFPLDLITWTFGGLAFVLLWAMAATSNDILQKGMGAWWRRLHRFGMHYVWLIFVQTAMFSPFSLALLLGAAGLRLGAFVKSRRAMAAAAAR